LPALASYVPQILIAYRKIKIGSDYSNSLNAIKESAEQHLASINSNTYFSDLVNNIVEDKTINEGWG